MDAAWWKTYGEEAKATFQGEFWAPMRVPGVRRAVFNNGKNSGAGAIALAAHWGATRVILLGYDCQHTGGRAHWHGDHPDGLGNAGSVAKWPGQFAALAANLRDVSVVNCSRQTALTCFPREELGSALSDEPKTPVFVQGMHGLGDNLHQRAVVAALSRKHEVWLDTPWPCLYHDMPEVRLVSNGSKLRTQAKNVAREAEKFTRERPPASAKVLRVAYTPDEVRKAGSVLAAMAKHCGVRPGDFSLPIRPEWESRADSLIEQWGTSKPIMLYRPLVERTEWGGCRTRNPDRDAYRDIFEAIRDRFFVVSVADLAPGKEWMVSHPVEADVEYHKGELDIELLAAVVARSALVFTPPGFAVVLSQAVGTPVISIFGGYENAKSFLGGAHLAPYLGIDPIKPCECFSHSHACQKKIDVQAAKVRAAQFAATNCPQQALGDALAA